MMKVSSEVFRLQVLVNNRPVQEYRGPSNATFIEGKQGSTFELELTNLTPRRIMVHPTVDGLSAMTGKTAAKNDARGYVLYAHQSMRVPGWRLDNNSVAQFYFAGNGNSYAEQIGQGADKGVIACTIWEEIIAAQTPLYYDYRYSAPDHYSPLRPDSYQFSSRSQCSAGGGLQSNSPIYGTVHVNCCHTEEKCSGGVQNLGTGFGKVADHRVSSTTFIPAQRPTCVAVIYYDDFLGLQRRGIKISKKKTPRLPNPFPSDVGCTPPDGWTG